MATQKDSKATVATDTKTAAKTNKATAKQSAKVESTLETTIDTLENKTIPAFKKLVSENIDSAQGLAKQVWFAYLGAVGRTVDEVKDRYEQTTDDLTSRVAKLNEDRQALIQDLVDRGEKVQDEAQVRFQEGRVTVEEQIESAKARLTGLTSFVDVPARLQDLSDKLESLSKDLKKSA